MTELFNNNAASTLDGAITDVATSLAVQAGDGALFPSPTGNEYFYLTLDDGAGSVEIVKCTARSTDTLTVVRGQQGTSGTAFSDGDTVEQRWTAETAQLGSVARGGYGSDDWQLLLSPGANSTSGSGTDQPFYQPIRVEREITIDGLGIRVSSASATGVVRLGLYYDAGGVPGALIVDGGTVSTTSAGFKSVAISSTTLKPGIYWTSLVGQTEGATFNAASGWCPLMHGGTGGVGAGDVRSIKDADSSVTGALPDPADPTGANHTRGFAVNLLVV